MKKLIAGLSLFIAMNAIPASANETTEEALKLVDAAIARTASFVKYDPAYVRLDYPGGDISQDRGVCTDVVIRSYRDGLNFDLQKAVHEDMSANFAKYPSIWGLSRPDRNIDHRRVPNLEVYFARHGQSLGKSLDYDTFLPGDIVSWRLGGWLAHIGIVSDRKTEDGIPYIIHNVGQGTVEENVLSAYGDWIQGHYRFLPPS